VGVQLPSLPKMGVATKCDKVSMHEGMKTLLQKMKSEEVTKNRTAYSIVEKKSACSY
jgi:hypothetical protein